MAARLNQAQPIVFPDGTMQNPFRDFLLKLELASLDGNLAVDWANIINTPTTIEGYGITGGTFSASITVNGDISVTGTIDGRDVAADGLKLDGIEASANNYVHPSHPGDDFSVDTGALTGATVVSDIDINVTTDTLGHVTDANGAVATRTLTLADLGYTGDPNANEYTHPAYAGDDIDVDTGPLTGAVVISDIDFNVTTDALGHVTDANGVVATRTLTPADIGALADTTDTLTGDLDVTGSVTAGSNTNEVRMGTDGLYFEGDKHAITFNDGFGNFNLRVANNGITDENCTEAGYLSHLVFNQSSGLWQWNVSSASLSIGNAPTWRVQIEWDANDVTLMYQGSARIVTTSAGVTVTGEGTATDWVATSDKRKKQDIETAFGDAVYEMRGVTFQRDTGQRSAGVIAQELRRVAPDLVREDEDGYLSVVYDGLSGYLIEAVKKQRELIYQLEDRIRILELRA